MHLVNGNFLEALNYSNSLVVAPTNGVIVNGHLVMGAGAAKALQNRFNRLSKALGQAIAAQHQPVGGVYTYYFEPICYYDDDGRLFNLAAFQTKYHWRHPADLALLARSAEHLAQHLFDCPELTAHMAFPGVGLGRLNPKQVLAALETPLQSVKNRVYLYYL